MHKAGGDQTDVVEEPTTTVAVETPTNVPDVTTTTTTPPIPSEAPIIPIVPSQATPADQGPLEWRWDPNTVDSPDATSSLWPVNGWYCYGSGGDRSTVVEFGGGSIKVQSGFVRTPEIVVTDAEGTVANAGNPLGEQAWLCSVAATDTHLPAVGSSVWWSADGIAWNAVEEFEVFEEVDYRNVDGWNLMWAAAGPGGYIVLGRGNFSERAPNGERVGWYSDDLESWYEIPVKHDVWRWTPVELRSDDGPSAYEYAGPWWGWGPPAIAVGDEPIIHLYSGAWIGTRP